MSRSLERTAIIGVINGFGAALFTVPMGHKYELLDIAVYSAADGDTIAAVTLEPDGGGFIFVATVGPGFVNDLVGTMALQGFPYYEGDTATCYLANSTANGQIVASYIDVNYGS